MVSSVVWSADGKYLAVGHTVHQAALDIYDTKKWNLVGKAVDDEFSQYPLAQFVNSDKDLVLPRRIGGNYPANSLPPADDSISLEELNIEQNMVEKTFYASFNSDKNSFEFSEPLSRNEQEHASLASAVAVSSDGRYVAASVGTGVLIYSLASAQVIQNIKCETHFVASSTPFTVRYNAPSSIAFSPDSKEILLANCDYGSASVYDVISGNLVSEVHIGGDIVAYNYDGTFAAVASSGFYDSHESGNVTIFRVSDGAIIGSSPREDAFVSNVQWIPHRNLVLVSYQAVYGSNWDTGASLEGTDNSDVRIWDGTTLQLVAEFRGWQLGAAAFSPDGSKIAIGSANKVIIGSVD